MLRQQFASIAYPDLINIGLERFSVHPFKETAKGRRIHIGYFGNLAQDDCLVKIIEDIFIDLIQIFIVPFFKCIKIPLTA